MLKPAIVKIPDFSKYLNKNFVFLEDLKLSDRCFIFCKGMRFTIKKIKGDWITIKVISGLDECAPAIKLFNDKIIKDHEKEIKIFDRILKLWKTDPKKFVVDKSYYGNKPDSQNDNRGGHCINTGYFDIPKNHPDKYGMAEYGRFGIHRDKDDTIMTMNYVRTDGLKNFYSYQTGKNEWYSSECYKYMRLASVDELEERKTYTLAVRKWLHSIIVEKQGMPIQKLNAVKFKQIK